MEDYLKYQEFYDLMQAYRMASPSDQTRVIECFDAVKTWIVETSLRTTKWGLFDADDELLDVFHHEADAVAKMNELAEVHRPLEGQFYVEVYQIK
jgi:hypothetical protein